MSNKRIFVNGIQMAVTCFVIYLHLSEETEE